MKPVSLVPFLLAYLLGIPFAFTQPSELCFLLVFFGAFWCTYCWKFRGDPWHFLLIIGFFLLGLGRGNLQLILPKKRYSHFVNPQSENQFIVRFTQALNNHRFDHRYNGEVLWTNTHKSEGKILVSINKSIPVEVMVGEEYQYRGRLHPMEKPKNPFDFDYAKHLKQQGIYHHLRIKDSSRVLLHQKNPKVNMERILLKSAPAMVVIDGSNTPYYISRWRRTLNAYAIDYWLTHERGAYRVNLESVE